MRKLGLDLVSEATWSESIIQLMLLIQSIGSADIATLETLYSKSVLYGDEGD